MCQRRKGRREAEKRGGERPRYLEEMKGLKEQL